MINKKNENVNLKCYFLSVHCSLIKNMLNEKPRALQIKHKFFFDCFLNNEVINKTV